MAVKDLLNHRVTLSVGPDQTFNGTVPFVGNDYLVLEEDSVGTVMFPLEHVKYVCVSTTPSADEQGTERVDESNTWISGNTSVQLMDLLRTLKDTVVQLRGGGGDPTDGYLVDVMDEYLILVVIPDGALFFPIHHVQMVVPRNASIRPEFLTWATTVLIDLPNGLRFIDALNSEVGKMIKLGRGGPEDISGILRVADEDFVEIVVSPHEAVYIPTHHVKAFSRVLSCDWRSVGVTPTT